MRLQRSGDIFREGESSVWLGPFYHSERGVAQRLYELNHGRMWQLESLSQEELDKAQAHTGLSLGGHNRETRLSAPFECGGVMVLTGGAREPERPLL